MAYAVSAYGSGVGFSGFPLIAVLVLHASPLLLPRRQDPALGIRARAGNSPCPPTGRRRFA
ncbi:hypothetical protein ACLMAL_37455 [Nocardia sp. CWNU-33]|uniref:hypothetical protein n=1 Tax=Nocardia sp. CWNU-33 TaxID=3392117 RepID=UPI00398EE2F6